jgi:hypothetical protein
MLREAQKFLDLDMVAQTILDDGDRSLILESIQCYQIGSHRAAVILAWCATADCLKRHILELATEGDAQAQAAQTELKRHEAQACFEEHLILHARKCDLIDDFDEKSLRFARDTRSQCAHPTGVVPSAEAVRHIIYICTQSVLSRQGYRGIAYIDDVVTIQFDDVHFLPDAAKQLEHCRDIIRKVPGRLWPQFARVAAQKRPSSQSEVWLRNATTFFRELLSQANDGVAKQIASALQGFEAGSPDFFATIVGLDDRVSLFWDDQKRAQARARLLTVSATRMTPDIVHSWAVICAADGLQDADRDLLRQKFGYIARHLAGEKTLLAERRDDLLQLLQSMLLDDGTSVQSAVALGHLTGSELFSETSDAAQVIVETLIERFERDDRYRGILRQMSLWTGVLLKLFLEETELFLAECSDENPDDVLFLFDAAREVCRRAPHQIPDAFPTAINRLLKKGNHPEWADLSSSAGRVFHTQLSLLLQQNKTALPSIEDALVLKFDPADDEEAEADGGKT